MIGRLTGRLDWKGSDQVLLDVGGVGYVVHVSERTVAELPPVKTPVSLWTELLVREDLLQLFGFQTVREREWHRLLTSVQGVGAKVSLAILGTLGPEGVARAIALGDAAAVKAAPGVGPKIAQRVVNELQGKAPAMMLMEEVEATPVPSVPASAPVAPTTGAAPRPKAASSAQSEALSALTNLGYAPQDAVRAVAEAAGEAEGTAELIRAALKRLAPGEK
ncbi:Holliday junction branch migration protein RuvA [Jannaschia seohaensis]|uniref:Holliday junction branch migration complex subunit RuvA n=1 Tax=Jannaschia seohaensis TaxID=475081 RepID=A0A2Y9A8D1_9RHOB|nr:Holliday junction branch migration protein RuvA [Jannaschia seohaensis]PWJ22531.1 Holliday junction DNA helicase RuvA [Jannaschia seohaensis]SSA38809.1 holliday junction DNA helicase RuvA [Jannaschia seohaensis]